MTQLHSKTVFDRIREAYSVVLVIFSIAMIMGLIFTGQTKLASEVHPALAFIVIWVAIIWLTMIEGGQAAIVGLAPVHRELYKDSHKLAYRCTGITNKGDNLDRYLLGRQFLVCLIVFVINQCGSPLPDAELWGLPSIITNIFLVTGLAMILFTCICGQLNSEVNGCHCMLDYLSNWFGYFTVQVSMLVEFSGLLHASYLIQMSVSYLAGKPVESQEEPRSGFTWVFFWARCLMSLGILSFALAVTITAIAQGYTTMWEGCPKPVAIIIFFVLMCFVGLLEGMQIAFFAVTKVTKEERGTNWFARKTCELLFTGEGRNLPGFMVGRQMCVVSMMFFVARITSLTIVPGEGNNIFGVSDGIQNFFNTGLLGALITTIIGSIGWRLVAAAFPIAFLSNPLAFVFLRICLFLEWTGLCSGAWVIAEVHAKVAHFQRDEVYIGTAEERAAKNFADDEDLLQVGPGHPRIIPNFIEHAPESLKKLAKSDPAVLEYIASIRKMDAGQVEQTEDEHSDQ
ncbi:hypothetical protein MPSEU_000811500 [Mayamaea pseudoterrestris]|nr:hypothetical protein MPSEU_000811500 [Mayamaea pseudoterrestris]